jgi:putative nucleotidyltransferase with HDIG domain
MINREQAMLLLKEHLKNINLQNHCLAVATVMEALALRMNEDVEKWYLAGLLHDIDYDMTFETPEKHALIAMDILKDIDVSDDIRQAIRSHSGNFPLESLMDKALWCADPVTGLILASALMTPEKKISAIKQSSLMKKYKSKGFAAGANREQIASSENIGITLADFLALATEAMIKIEGLIIGT